MADAEVALCAVEEAVLSAVEEDLEVEVGVAQEVA